MGSVGWLGCRWSQDQETRLLLTRKETETQRGGRGLPKVTGKRVAETASLSPGLVSVLPPAQNLQWQQSGWEIGGMG